MKIAFSSCDVTLSKPTLSCGTSVTGETPNGAVRQEAHRTLRGKRTAWNGNQLLLKTTNLAKNSLYKKSECRLLLIGSLFFMFIGKCIF
jgi:hypothetical protein